MESKESIGLCETDVTDPQPPLEVHGERQVFREQGGADYTVTAIDATVRETGEPLTLHVTSVKDGKPGVVCVAVRDGEADPRSVVSSEHVARKILLARHWRVSTGEWGWEFPRGMGETGETTEGTAVREFREETGMEVGEDRVRILQTIHADTGVLRDATAVAVIDVPDDIHIGRAEDWELTNLRWIPEDVLCEMIAGVQITDGITLAAFAVLMAHC